MCNAVNDRHAFVHDASTPFYSTAHVFVMVFAAAVLLLVTIGVPVWIHRKTKRIIREGKVDDPLTQREFGAIYNAYDLPKETGGFVSFETLSLARRSVVIGVDIAAQSYPMFQVMVQLGLSLAYGLWI